MTIRVLVADDQALVRAGFRGIVDAADGFTVVGEAATGAEAVELARRTAPDVVLMDIRMPGTDGLAATRQIAGSRASNSSAGEVKVLILTTYDIDDYVYTALRAGASGFLLKDTPPEELLAAIRVVAAGDALLAPSITRRLIREFAARPAPPVCEDPYTAAQLATITEREREVLTLIGQGLTNSEIAERLFITTGTVKTHVGHLLAKSAARDRVHLVILAHRAGLVG
ncbi:LuxR family transcriptional regulator [Kitasatospora griseola]|uniref:LuxR family transcriptional regulator n=1 Tax=Kitasatospora griseola TaxID=2064 RepID=A0A0D0Q3I0_KITGR|nr:response regulator transcription factor [Kitasatospora griseola]KIQ65518.1 LuxR family transcriptional regulator [Kitasatospora griseola]